MDGRMRNCERRPGIGSTTTVACAEYRRAGPQRNNSGVSSLGSLHGRCSSDVSNFAVNLGPGQQHKTKARLRVAEF